jgi:hypothetical protein
VSGAITLWSVQEARTGNQRVWAIPIASFQSTRKRLLLIHTLNVLVSPILEIIACESEEDRRWRFTRAAMAMMAEHQTQPSCSRVKQLE